MREPMCPVAPVIKTSFSERPIFAVCGRMRRDEKSSKEVRISGLSQEEWCTVLDFGASWVAFSTNIIRGVRKSLGVDLGMKKRVH